MNTTLLGTIMSIVWVGYVTIGFISQIIKNQKSKSFGWSIPLFLLAYITYIFGVLYAISSKDIFIMIPYSIGFILLNYLLIQFLKYKK